MNAHIEMIDRAARELAAGDKGSALEMAERLRLPHYLEGLPEERLAHAFGSGLVARILGNAKECGNLYLNGTGPDEMLNAFQVLVEQTPLVRFGYSVANETLLRSIGDSKILHVIDIGIGRGGQWHGFLAKLAQRQHRVRVRLTGIEVPGSDAQLAEVGIALEMQAKQLGIDFSFVPLAAKVEELVDFGTRPDETVFVNASFALHHVPDGDAVLDISLSRDAVLRRIRALSPRMLVLVEPDVEHNALSFPDRVEESSAHYAVVFDMFEHLFPRDFLPRQILEQGFFAKEIVNIVAGEGAMRVERHERKEAWRQRLLRQDFHLGDLSSMAEALARELQLTEPFSITASDGVLTLRWKGEPMVSAFSWQAVGEN
jgi:hypothetical protein